MEEDAEERAGKKDARESESFKSTILPVLLGLIVDLIVDAFSGLSSSAKMMVIVGLSVAYTAGELLGKRPKSFGISSRAKRLMTAAFVIAVLLLLGAAFILGLSLAATAFLTGWTILMALSLRLASSVPEGGVLARVALTRISAFTLGAALAIGGAPVAEVAFGGPAHLTIINDCGDDLEYAPLNISIPAGESQTKEMPPIVVDVEHRGNVIQVGGTLGPKAPFPLSQGIEISIDDRPLRPGDSRRIDLGDGKDHRLRIRCI